MSLELDDTKLDGNKTARRLSKLTVQELASEARRSTLTSSAPTYLRSESVLPDDDQDNAPAQGSVLCRAWRYFMGNLTLKTLVGVLFGFVLGASLREASPSKDVTTLIGYPGDLFVSALKMVVIPLIAVGMILAVTKLGDISKVKRTGKRALLYYCGTTFIAAVEGLVFVNILQPGKNKGGGSSGSFDRCNDGASSMCKAIPWNITGNFSGANCTDFLNTRVCADDALPRKETLDAFLDIGRTMLPDNVFVAITTNNILGVIVFCLLFGFYLNREAKDEVAVVQKFLNATNGTLMSMVEMLIEFTPVGIFSLVAGQVLSAKDLWVDLQKLGLFVVTVVLGILCHALVTYPSLFFIFTRKSPFNFYKNLANPVMAAFATSSSAATLPVTMKSVEQAGVHTDISRFILPLGATINMDGTAIYFPIAVIFLANWSGVALDFGQMISISVVSAFVSIGAAPIPSAGLVYLILIMNSVGIQPSENISLVLAIDWFLDRIQTCCNVCGDSFGSALLEHYRQQDVAFGAVSPDESPLTHQEEMDDMSRRSFEGPVAPA